MKMKGKCYSKVNQGQRNKKDFYQTPYKMTKSFLDLHRKLKEPILEPACGQGAITKVLFDYGYTDIYSYDIQQGYDFFQEKNKYQSIITNPPYSKANKWILKCMKVAIEEFALLLPLNYLQGQWRYKNIYARKEMKIPDFYLSFIYIFSRMPTLTKNIRKDGKYETGMQAYAWYVWEKTVWPQTIIKWIDSSNHIVRKGD